MKNSADEIDELMNELVNGDQKRRIDLLKERLPEEEKREYEIILTKLAQKLPEAEKVFWEILQTTEDKDSEEYDKVAFACFVALNIYYRHKMDISKLRNLVSHFEDHFQNEKHPLLPHVLSIYYKTLGTEKINLEKSLEYARAAAKRLEHAGVYHNLAETLVNWVDEGYCETPTQRESYLKEADELIDKAIKMNPDYAKFYSTKAQLLSIQGDFARAMKYINEAIDKEDSSANDYAIRIAGYLTVKAKILFRKYLREAVDQAKQEIEKELERYRLQSIELLGLFAALISFVVSSIQFITAQSVENVALLMLLFTGSILGIYGGLGVILYGRRHLMRIVAVLALAATLVVLALVMIW